MKNFKDNLIIVLIVTAVGTAFALVSELENKIFLANTKQHIEYIQEQQ